MYWGQLKKNGEKKDKNDKIDSDLLYAYISQITCVTIIIKLCALRCGEVKILLLQEFSTNNIYI